MLPDVRRTTPGRGDDVGEPGEGGDRVTYYEGEIADEFQAGRDAFARGSVWGLDDKEARIAAKQASTDVERAFWLGYAWEFRIRGIA